MTGQIAALAVVGSIAAVLLGVAGIAAIIRELWREPNWDCSMHEDER